MENRKSKVMSQEDCIKVMKRLNALGFHFSIEGATKLWDKYYDDATFTRWFVTYDPKDLNNRILS